VMLPELRTGDWLLFPDSGAYTVAVGAERGGEKRGFPWAPRECGVGKRGRVGVYGLPARLRLVD
jgi:hypothetical protein